MDSKLEDKLDKPFLAEGSMQIGLLDLKQCFAIFCHSKYLKPPADTTNIISYVLCKRN